MGRGRKPGRHKNQAVTESQVGPSKGASVSNGMKGAGNTDGKGVTRFNHSKNPGAVNANNFLKDPD